MEASQGGGAYGGRGPEILGVSWALMGVTTIFIILRLHLRFFTVQQAGRSADVWSLIWAVLAWIFGVAGTSFLSVAAHYGLGNQETKAVDQESVSKAVLYALVWLTLNTLMVVWTKFSVVALLFEIQQPTHKSLKLASFSLMIISLCANIVNVFLIWFQCTPSKKLWEPSTPGSCGLQIINYDYSIFTGSWSAFVDLYLTLCSFYILAFQPISGKLKILSGFLVGLGVFTSVCACMRTYELHVLRKSVDKTRDSAPFVLWSVAECWIAVIVSSVPSIWPLLQNQLEFLHLSSETSSEHGDNEKPDIDDRHVSARSYATTATDYTTRTNATTATTATHATTATNVTTTTNTLSLSGSTAGQNLDGAIAVRKEVTVDREARRRSQGFCPRADTRSWARVDVEGLARWDSERAATSPSWARRPSWSRRPSLPRNGSSTLSRLNSSVTGSNTWARKPSLPGIAQ